MPAPDKQCPLVLQSNHNNSRLVVALPEQSTSYSHPPLDAANELNPVVDASGEGGVFESSTPDSPPSKLAKLNDIVQRKRNTVVCDSFYVLDEDLIGKISSSFSSKEVLACSQRSSFQRAAEKRRDLFISIKDAMTFSPLVMSPLTANDPRHLTSFVLPALSPLLPRPANLLPAKSGDAFWLSYLRRHAVAHSESVQNWTETLEKPQTSIEQ